MSEGEREVSISYSCGRKCVMRQKHMDIIIAPLDRELRGPWKGYWLSPSTGGLKQDTGFA